MRVVGWFVIALYGSLLIGVGVCDSRQNGTAYDFLLSGRNMLPIAVGLSVFFSLVSSPADLSHPGEMITYDPMPVIQIAAQRLILVLVVYGLIPLQMRQPVTNADEIHESRLGSEIRRVGAAAFLLTRFNRVVPCSLASSLE